MRTYDLILAVVGLLLTFTIDSNGAGIAVRRKQKVLSEQFPFINGTTYFISSIMDGSVITVHPNGDVTTEQFTGAPEQKWRVVTHPREPGALEFKQDVVPYNMLSGYEDPPENPGIFPRPLGLANRGLVGKIPSWNIKIRGRWCLQANGYSYPMDMDDCEDYFAPWQLWELEEVL